MTYAVVLLLHIGIAIISVGVLGYALYLLATNQSQHYRWLLSVILGITTLEIVTGSALVYLSPTVTALSLCDNIAVYVTVTGLVSWWLYRETYTKTLFPAWELSGVSISLVTFASLVVLGI